MRRAYCTLLCLTVLAPSLAGGEDSGVPVALQVELLVKVASHDSNMAKRAGDRVLAVVLSKAGNGDSSQASSAATTALKLKSTLRGLPLVVEGALFGKAADLPALCRTKRVSIIYVTPGFTDDEVGAIGAALDGVDVLTASGVPRYIQKGIVLGFDMVSGRPKLVLSMGQARRQNVAIETAVLGLMDVRP